MASSVSAFKKAQKDAADLVAQTVVVPTTMFDPKNWEKACVAIEAAYPELKPDLAAVTAAGKGKTGAAQKLAVYVRAKDRATNTKAGNVTLYSSGKAVWTNVAPVAL